MREKYTEREREPRDRTFRVRSSVTPEPAIFFQKLTTRTTVYIINIMGKSIKLFFVYVRG